MYAIGCAHTRLNRRNILTQTIYIVDAMLMGNTTAKTRIHTHICTTVGLYDNRSSNQQPALTIIITLPLSNSQTLSEQWRKRTNCKILSKLKITSKQNRCDCT